MVQSKFLQGAEYIINQDGLFTLTMTEGYKTQTRQQVLEQSLEVVRRRIDEMGTREPNITRQGDDRIVVEVPGLADPSEGQQECAVAWSRALCRRRGALHRRADGRRHRPSTALGHARRRGGGDESTGKVVRERDATSLLRRPSHVGGARSRARARRLRRRPEGLQRAQARGDPDGLVRRVPGRRLVVTPLWRSQDISLRDSFCLLFHVNLQTALRSRR